MLHVAAAVDPEVKGARIQAWGHYCNWDDVLAIMRRRYPREKFVDDFANGAKFACTTDSSEAIALMKKWGPQNGWRPLEQTVAENIDVLFSWYPRS